MNCPNCHTCNIPDEANFCPDCGMYLSHEGPKMTIARYPDGGTYHQEKVPGGFWAKVYVPTLRESKAKEYLENEYSQIPARIWDKYNIIGNPFDGHYYRNANYNYCVIFAINKVFEQDYNLKKIWLVDEKMCHSYRKSKSLLLRVGADILSIKPICSMDGYEVVKAEELIWQEIECDKYGYIPCLAYIQQRPTSNTINSCWTTRWSIKNCTIVNAITKVPLDFSAINMHNRKMAYNEIQLLAIQEIIKIEKIRVYEYELSDTRTNVYNRERFGKQYYIELNDEWGSDKIQVAKEIRSHHVINGTIGMEPIFYRVSIKSATGEEPTFDDFLISVEKADFNHESLLTAEELAKQKEFIESMRRSRNPEEDLRNLVVQMMKNRSKE